MVSKGSTRVLLLKGGKNLCLKENRLVGRDKPALLILSTILDLGNRTRDGETVIAVRLPWFEITQAILRDPKFLEQFPGNYRAFEEFLAGIYRQQGYNVELTPRSNDMVET